jgi:hypothetical protein
LGEREFVEVMKVKREEGWGREEESETAVVAASG